MQTQTNTAARSLALADLVARGNYYRATYTRGGFETGPELAGVALIETRDKYREVSAERAIAWLYSLTERPRSDARNNMIMNAIHAVGWAADQGGAS